ncbi:hypothetical protein [Cupriavidus basilensis]|uniref:Uncharacterized protein n=1 Tax=Cupriavidus basilensis TaxID=68895 RepID=A0A7M2GZE5_9BURK|nr:hypothetical protein [Cupriavidus basilensis]MCP3022625.1 hypothetical protein [Cupriavidus basilensis]QOT78194.1 hypothetical protein F7R26_009380 [Cupriavidus basilensis]
MRDPADPMLARGRKVLAGAALAAPVATSECMINCLRPAIGDTLIARLGEGSQVRQARDGRESAFFFPRAI